MVTKQRSPRMGPWSRTSLASLGRLGPLSQPAFTRQDNRLCAALDGDLVEDAGDVVAHGFFGQLEARGDLRVVQALRDQLEHALLARRELAEAAAPARRIERGDRGEEFLPGRLALQHAVIAALERHESRAGNEA